MSKTVIDNTTNNYFVYCHKNKSNGKVYIGITNNLSRRWRRGGGYTIDKNPLFGKAVKKYGWDGFEHIILESGLTLDEAMEKEKKYIAYYKSNAYRYNNPTYGYNLTDGGEGFYGVDRSGEKNSFYGKHHSDEAKRKIGDANRGENSPNYGRTVSVDELHRLIDPKKKPVVCITTGEIFESASDAARKLSLSESSISLCCRGVYHRVTGLLFRYVDNQNLEMVHHKKVRGKPVICVETGIVYSSTSSASKTTSIGQAAIWDCCNNRRKTMVAGGFTWRYATEEEIASQLLKYGKLGGS